MRDALVSGGAFLVFAAVGYGPAAALLARSRRLPWEAAALAPALGLGLLGLLSVPLCRYAGPVGLWSAPATAVLTAVSLGLAWRRLGRKGPAATPGDAPLSPRSLALALAAFLACFALMQAPSILRGLDYTAWRSNPADAFVYISLAETLRVAPWPVLIAGSNLGDTAGAAALAATSPTALLSARFLDLPVALGNMGALAWVADLLRHPVYRTYFPYEVAATATLFPLGCLLGAELRLRRATLLGLAGVLAIGFWSRWLLETDASFQICGAPLFLAAVFAWSRFEEEERSRIWSRPVLLFGLSLAALWVLYFPYLVTLAFAVAAWLAWKAVRREASWGGVFRYAAPGAACLAALGVTGQLDYYLGNAAFLISRPGIEKQYRADVFHIFRENGPAGVWGLPPAFLLERAGGAARLAGGAGLQLLALAFTAGLALAVRRAREPGAEAAGQRVVAAAAGGLLLVAVCAAQANFRTAGKAFVYCYPLVVLAVAWGFDRVGSPTGWRRAAGLVLPTWLGAQWFAGAYLSVLTVSHKGYTAAAGRPFRLDLSPITAELDRLHPRLLAVNAPRLPDWPFAFYVMLVLAPYRPYYQSGLITDNSAVAPNFRLPPPSGTPDYVVTLRDDDYLAARGLGQVVAETPQLRLYRVTGGAPADFAPRDVTIRSGGAGR